MAMGEEERDLRWARFYGTAIGLVLMAAWIVIPALLTFYLWKKGCGCWAFLGMIPTWWTFTRFWYWLRFKDPSQ